MTPEAGVSPCSDHEDSGWVNVVEAGVTSRYLMNYSTSGEATADTTSTAKSVSQIDRKRTHFRPGESSSRGFAGMTRSEETVGAR